MVSTASLIVVLSQYVQVLLRCRRTILPQTGARRLLRQARVRAFCVSARSVHVCGPFLLPIFRWGIDSSSSPPSASDGPSGKAAGMEANKRRLTLDLASTLQRWLKVWRSRASACAGAVKPPSTGRPTEGEADTRFWAAACAIANTRRERLSGDMLSVPG